MLQRPLACGLFSRLLVHFVLLPVCVGQVKSRVTERDKEGLYKGTIDCFAKTFKRQDGREFQNWPQRSLELIYLLLA